MADLLFILEWSVWDTVISRHYENTSKDAKDFLYELVSLNAENGIKISVIPPELRATLEDAFSDRPIFEFLLENGALVKEAPRLKGLEPTHRAQTIMLALSEILSHRTAYIVSEDPNFKTAIDSMPLPKNISNYIKSVIINCKTANDYLNQFKKS